MRFGSVGFSWQAWAFIFAYFILVARCVLVLDDVAYSEPGGIHVDAAQLTETPHAIANTPNSRWSENTAQLKHAPDALRESPWACICCPSEHPDWDQNFLEAIKEDRQADGRQTETQWGHCEDESHPDLSCKILHTVNGIPVCLYNPVVAFTTMECVFPTGEEFGFFGESTLNSALTDDCSCQGKGLNPVFMSLRGLILAWPTVLSFQNNGFCMGCDSTRLEVRSQMMNVLIREKHTIVRGLDEVRKAKAVVAEMHALLEVGLARFANSHRGALWAFRELSRRIVRLLCALVKRKQGEPTFEATDHNNLEAWMRDQMDNTNSPGPYNFGAFIPTLENIKEVLRSGNLRECFWLYQAFADVLTLEKTKKLFAYLEKVNLSEPNEANFLQDAGIEMYYLKMRRRHLELCRTPGHARRCISGMSLLTPTSMWVEKLKGASFDVGLPKDEYENKVKPFRQFHGFKTVPLTNKLLRGSDPNKTGYYSEKLTERECEWLRVHDSDNKYLGDGTKNPSPCDVGHESDPLPWAAGGMLNILLEGLSRLNKGKITGWLPRMRGLGMPALAGPSGTTETVFIVARLLGMDGPMLNALELAVAGGMLVVGHHSYGEIRLGTYGCNRLRRYSRTETVQSTMYDDIMPDMPQTLEETVVTYHGADGWTWQRQPKSTLDFWTGETFQKELLDITEEIDNIPCLWASFQFRPLNLQMGEDTIDYPESIDWSTQNVKQFCDEGNFTTWLGSHTTKQVRERLSPLQKKLVCSDELTLLSQTARQLLGCTLQENVS